VGLLSGRLPLKLLVAVLAVLQGQEKLRNQRLNLDVTVTHQI
jgi:hypothetical protein